MTAYKIALIGCGRIGVWLEDDPLRGKPASHLGGINKLIRDNSIKKGLELCAICDIDSYRLDQVRERTQLPIEKCFTDYQELITTEKPDIIIVASWTSSHHEIALFAAKNGVKGIVMEKPLAVSFEHASEIVSTCSQYNTRLVVNHERRWDPAYRKTKRLIEHQALGKLKSIVGNVFSRSAPIGSWEEFLDKAGGGPLLHDGTHLVDMFRYFAGDIDTITGFVSRENLSYATETTATAVLQTKNGVTIFMEAGGMREYFNFELDLQFEKGRIRIGNGIREYFVTQQSTRYSGFTDLVKAPFPDFSYDSDPFTGAILDLISSIETGNEPSSSGQDGLKTMEIIFGIYYSAYLNGNRVTLPLKLSGHPLKKMFRMGML